MINEAEQNAEADKERREIVETRNQAEQLIHSTEKMLTDFGEKIDPSEKTEVEKLIEDAKAAIAGDDAAQINSTMEALQQGSMKLGEAMYKAQQEEGKQLLTLIIRVRELGTRI